MCHSRDHCKLVYCCGRQCSWRLGGNFFFTFIHETPLSHFYLFIHDVRQEICARVNSALEDGIASSQVQFTPFPLRKSLEVI